MKILMVNKFHYLKGGSEKYYFELAELLRENGHEVAFFSMKNEKNIKTNCKEFLVKDFDLNNNNKLKALDVIYSKENKKKMTQALEEFKPDIVHLNNFQRQLSSSIVEAIYEKNIPIVFTAHDLEAVCPNKTMLDGDTNICEKCIQGKYINCVRKKCIKSSMLKSTLGSIEAQYYRKKKIYTKKINKIITPSEFYRKKLTEDGIPENKIVSMPNFIDMKEYDIETDDNGYALYFGRLSKEKGIMNLMMAFKKINKGKLNIAGEGPEKANIEKFIEENNLQNRVKLLGFLKKNEIRETIRKSRFVVLPSIWNDNCPYSVMETLAIGKPVIGSDIGGIPELVKNNENGFTYKYDDIDELAEKMQVLFENEELVKKFSFNAKENAKKLYNKNVYYQKIIKIYENLLKEKK